MITDKQIEAALTAYLPELFRPSSTLRGTSIWDDMRAALEAAEAAAWCDDIGQAPRNGTAILAQDDDGEPYLVSWLDSRWWIEDTYLTDEQIKRWRHLPQPPVRDEKMGGGK